MNPAIEISSPQDLYYNYCWWPYQPIASAEGKFRQSTLLFHSFQLADVCEPARRMVDTMREEIGFFRTVYGVKWSGRELSWEYYLYDYKRLNRKVSMTRVLSAIRTLAACPVGFPEDRPYFMFSFDLNPAMLAGKHGINLVNMYIGNPGSTVSSGISYALTAEKSELENFYFFFDAKKHLPQTADKILCSAYLGQDGAPLDAILRPELKDCHTICVANKRRNDTIYFSGITVQQLLWFLRFANYPTKIIEFVAQHENRLDHLLFDAGFDYKVADGRLKILKSGYYGVF